MYLVSKRVGSNVGFKFVASSDVDALGNEFLDLGDYSRIIEQVYWPSGVEVEQ